MFLAEVPQSLNPASRDQQTISPFSTTQKHFLLFLFYVFPIICSVFLLPISVLLSIYPVGWCTVRNYHVERENLFLVFADAIRQGATVSDMTGFRAFQDW